MRRARFSKWQQKACVLLMTYCVLTPAWADLQSVLEHQFDEMANTTRPGVYESQRRGVLAGGQFIAKNHLFDENLIGFVPPAWKAGCGGVDLFGGSLSFINTDQIVQLLRSIAANAKGYAFQLALDNVFPDGAKWIENFQKKVQALNQYLGNSCQLAQGIVSDVASSFNLKHSTDASLKGTLSGLFEDFFDARQELDGQSPLEKLKQHRPDQYKQLIGNLVWQQLQRHQVSRWFPSGDSALMEAVMSMTGTIIVGDLASSAEGLTNAFAESAPVTPITILPGNKITLADLIEGGPVDLYSCEADPEQCLTAGKTKRVQLKGLKTVIQHALLGTGSRPGIIAKYASNAGALIDTERAFVSNLPEGLGTLLHSLALLSPEGATLFVTEASGALALSMAEHLTEEVFRATRAALANSDSPYQKQALDTLNRAQNTLRREYTTLIHRYGSLASQIAQYSSVLKAIRKPAYVPDAAAVFHEAE
ncbi:conjugal transfer protein TraH [Candidatus Glomeribacter gigasporarum]|nr:conjugal transfer protein TraH [Candidatus Glomeribacter gigasporarum]